MIRYTICAIFLVTTLAAAQQPARQEPGAPSSARDSETKVGSQDAAQPNTPQGQVLFHRNEEDPNNQQSTTTNRTPAPTVAAISNAERAALTIESWDLDVHLTPATQHLATRASITIRNTSAQPRTRITLQLSSTLQWESIAAANTQLPVTQHTIDTDADHTGEASEALISLPTPLAPNDTITLTALYSGTIPPSAHRLALLGGPPDRATALLWDQIAPDIIALRGYPFVLWYPVASPQVFITQGWEAATLLQRAQANSAFHVRLTIEYTGEPPADAFLNGRHQPFTHTTEEPNVPVAESRGIAIAEFPAAPIGFRTPSLFITWPPSRPSDNQLLSIITTRPEAMAPYTAAASSVAPLLRDWLGAAPLEPLTLIDHPGFPFEDDALLACPLNETDAKAITAIPSFFVHSLAHAWFRSPEPWLNEGVPELMHVLHVESADGRDQALIYLRSLVLPITALIEPEAIARLQQESEGAPSDFSSSNPPEQRVTGQPLTTANDALFYRNKAAAVLFMLRSITGDAALKQALQAYREQLRKSHTDDPRAFQHLLEQTSQKDLNWLFDDWVYNDRGLPDLSIVSVTPRELPGRAGAGASPAAGATRTWLVAVEISNAGSAAAEVPVTVRSGSLTATERVRIPARSRISTRIVFEGTPEEVQLNDGTTPELTTPIHTRRFSEK